MLKIIFLIYPFLHREYYLFSQNSASSIEQLKKIALLQKVNNSIATKLCVKLINNCTIFLKTNSARHNSMTKLCYVFFKYENKLKID